jgi:hypothetical protein
MEVEKKGGERADDRKQRHINRKIDKESWVGSLAEFVSGRKY